jgi:hypothetical protein
MNKSGDILDSCSLISFVLIDCGVITGIFAFWANRLMAVGFSLSPLPFGLSGWLITSFGLNPERQRFSRIVSENLELPK